MHVILLKKCVSRTEHPVEPVSVNLVSNADDVNDRAVSSVNVSEINLCHLEGD